MKYTIDYGMGTAVLYTPYPWEDRFYTLANECFGIRKNIMYVNLIDKEDVSCSDFERLEFCGDAYVWREDGARRMLAPDFEEEWDTSYCEDCRYNEPVDKNEEVAEEKVERDPNIITGEEATQASVDYYDDLISKHHNVLRENSELKKLCQDRCEEIEWLKKENETLSRENTEMNKIHHDDYDEIMRLEKEKSDLESKYNAYVLSKMGLKKINEELVDENFELRKKVERLEMTTSDNAFVEAAELKKKYDDLLEVHRNCREGFDTLMKKHDHVLDENKKYKTIINAVEAVLGRKILDE